jgi:superfamily II DNA/RNA helicase
LKTALLLKLLGNTSTDAVLVFTRTKHRAKQLGGKLAKAGYRSTSLQGNLSQSRRQDAMNGFKSGKYQVLVATDIAARGIDVSNISHVINYDMPSTPDTYIHRIGRTGRAENSGQAYTLITDEDRQMVRAIHGVMGMPVEQRTLTDFNYRTPMTNPTGQPGPRRAKSLPASRSRPQGGNGRKRNGRAAKGTFAWLSPQKTSRSSGRAGSSA